MSNENNKKIFDEFSQEMWYKNIASSGATFFCVSEATIKKWKKIDGNVPDSAIRIIELYKQNRKVTALLDSLSEDFYNLKARVRDYFAKEEKLKKMCDE